MFAKWSAKSCAAPDLLAVLRGFLRGPEMTVQFILGQLILGQLILSWLY
jgi:hypothetical protein